MSVGTSGLGGGDEWGDLKDRVHRLGNLHQGDEQEADLGFMGPEAYAIVELFKKCIYFTKTVPKIAGKVPGTVYKQTQRSLENKEEGLSSLCLSLQRGNAFPRILRSIPLKYRNFG